MSAFIDSLVQGSMEIGPNLPTAPVAEPISVAQGSDGNTGMAEGQGEKVNQDKLANPEGQGHRKPLGNDLGKAPATSVEENHPCRFWTTEGVSLVRFNLDLSCCLDKIKLKSFFYNGLNFAFTKIENFLVKRKMFL